MQDVWNWRNVRIFDGFSEKEHAEIMESMPLLTFYPGELLFKEGDFGDYLFLVKKGTVKTSHFTREGREHVLNIFSDGDIFGELFLGRQRHRIGYAKALDKVIACRLTERDFLALIHKFPRLGMNFIRHLAEEQRQTLLRLNGLLETDARQRLINTIYTLTRKSNGDWYTIHPSLTQEDIANMARLSRSTASMIINELRREGILGGSGRALQVNVSRLHSLVDSSHGQHHNGV